MYKNVENGVNEGRPVKREVISQRQQRLIHCTIEENFPQGTLQFISDFVSADHYLPKEIVHHLIKNLLLGSISTNVALNAYTVLMKIQRLHPANASNVQWDWDLLREVMEEKSFTDKPPTARLWFLQYVVQTLEDDFHVKLQLHMLPKSIAKGVLSCDGHFANVKNVIQWLVDAVDSSGPSANSGEPSRENELLNQGMHESIICLLQKMLHLAIEVDNSPALSSNKIVDQMFQHVLNISSRPKREILFNSMESHLLRYKVIEILFYHSCVDRRNLPMSLAKILHFLQNSTLYLETQDAYRGKKQTWDEMLYLLILMFLSYQEVMTGLLRLSVTERMMHVSAETLPARTMHEEISERDIQEYFDIFCNKVSEELGEEFLVQLQQKISLLKLLMQSTVMKY
ncbi:SUMO-interacting motif-containing protein 1 [Protopterus annectens]|uniref:SUMO-interacting motif-containing protein 1 n=1 Tax=Protopterus annectens TaxID=7888 RepID=UPI001CFA404B|nr:SUMO-interacting motif-containing protein 1 [Protopterus annectens]